MAKRMAFFSDVSGELIPEGKRVNVKATLPNGTVIAVDASEEELKNVKAPKPSPTGRIRMTFPDKKDRKPIAFPATEAEIRRMLPSELFSHAGLHSAADGSGNGAPSQVQETGEFKCVCGRAFDSQRGITRHVNTASDGQEHRQVEPAVA